MKLSKRKEEKKKKLPFNWTFWCRQICSLDASTIVRVRAQFSNPKVPTSTEESVSDRMDISCGAGATCILQLVADDEAWVGLNWSGNHLEHIMVAYCYCSTAVHFHHQVRWCVGWILMACICRLVGLCEAFIGFCCNVMVCFCTPFYLGYSYYIM